MGYVDCTGNSVLVLNVISSPTDCVHSVISDSILEFSCTSWCDGSAACSVYGDDPGHAKPRDIFWTIWGAGQR